MKKLTLCAALALFAAGAFAQTTGPGQDQSVPSKPATKSEKAAAKADRKAEGKAVAKTASTADADPSSMGTAKATTKSQKQSAKAKRKAEGATVAKQPKAGDGPN